MNKNNDAISLLPWLLVAFIIIAALAPYLGLRAPALKEEESTDQTTVENTSVKPALQELDDLVGK